ncbi:lipopolysaccharide biosynthesis protein [Oscillospiraceae bacterium LTW-04]
MSGVWNRIKRMAQKADAKHIVMLSVGVLSGQIISMLISPITTRLYAPETFGDLSLIVSLATMFVPIATLQYHISIVNSKDQDEYALCKLTFLLVILTSVIFLIGLIFFLHFKSEKYKSVGNLIYIAVFWFMMSGLVAIVESYNNRHNEYGLMAKITLRRSIVSNLVKVVLGLFHSSILGLLVGQTLGYIAGIKRQSQSIVRHMGYILAIDIKRVVEVAKIYKAQPFYALPGIFILQFSYSTLVLIINTIFSSREGGFFSLSVTILGIPLSLVSNNVSRVFFKNASAEYDNTGAFRSTLRSTAILLVAISSLGFTLLWFIAEPAFSLIYGNAWIRSGTFVKILIPMYAARFVVNGMMHGFVIANKQRLKTMLQSLFIVAILVGYNLASKNVLDIEEFLCFINWTYFGLYILLFIALWKQSGLESKGQKT